MTARPLDVVGIGSMVVDRVHRASRILAPDEKGILRAVDAGGPLRLAVGGVTLNHLGWAAALGLRTGIFGMQGDDEAGRFLRAAMDRLAIRRDIAITSAPTSFAEIFVDDAGGRSIYMAPGATSDTTPEHVRDAHGEFIRLARVVTTEVSQLPLAAAREALAIAEAAGAYTVLDLDVSPSDALATLGCEEDLDALLRGADLLKPSKLAAQEIAGSGGDALDVARALRRRFVNRAVVVTDGEAGCAVAADGFEGFVAARAVKAVDTTGAGDAFLGGLLAGHCRGLSWQDAARLANACGAACAEKIGAFPEDPDAACARVREFYTGEPIELAPALAELESPEHSAADRADPLHADALASDALALFDVALAELASLRDRLDARGIETALALVCAALARGARVHVTGIGKAEHVARYAAALLASTGTPATFLHATEAVHGSAGQVVENDVVIAVSNSGETPEMRAAVTAVRKMGASVVLVTGRTDSSLANHADAVLDAGVSREGGPLGLAPRASVAAEILVLAAFSASLERARGLTKEDYMLRHPAGILGESSPDPGPAE